MPNRKAKRSYANINELYRTYALANDGQTDADSKVTVPSEEDVLDAKEWVDENEK